MLRVQRTTRGWACSRLALVGFVLLGAPDSAPGLGEQRLTARGCLEIDGVIAARDDFRFLCQQSALLDAPIDEFLEVNARTRPGAVSPRIAKNLLIAGRCVLGPAAFQSLNGLPLLDQRDLIGTAGQKLGTSFGLGLLDGVARAARAIAVRDPGRALEMHGFLSSLVGASGVAYADTLNGLGFDPSDPATVLRRDGFDRLLELRADRDRPHDLATPGFDALAVADTVCELALGMEESVNNQADQIDLVTGQRLTNADLAGKPLFIGPDALRNTADDLPTQMCPPGSSPETRDFDAGPERFAGSRCLDDDSGAGVEPLYYLVGDLAASVGDSSSPGLLDLSGLSPADAEAACRAAVRIEDGGWNANGECISLSTDLRVGLFNRPFGGAGQQTVAAKPFLQDPAFRPPSAILEPTDLTDLRLRAAAAFIPARPPAPSGGVSFASAGPFSRRVDPTTGAPVRTSGMLACAHRTDAVGNRVGPDGDASTPTDNGIPSLGNCLLFDNPAADPATGDGLARQTLRSSDAIALDHRVNQKLFHTVCTIDFDEDTGRCPVDRLNDPALMEPTSNALSGAPGVTGVALAGYESVRLESSDLFIRYDEVGKAVFQSSIFANTTTFKGSTSRFSDQLSSEQVALLGCGPAFASACDSGQSLDFGAPGSAYRRAIGLEDRIRVAGGIDLQNADARVLHQEFMLRRDAAPGSLVGDTSGDGLGERFEAGVTHGTLGVAEARALGLDATRVARDAFLVTENPEELVCPRGLGLGQTVLPPCFDIAGNPEDPVLNPRRSVASFTLYIDSKVGSLREGLRKDLARSATDFQAEPTRWIRDPSAPNLRFLVPDIGPDRIVGTSDDDYRTLSNPLGSVDPNGEQCSPFFGGPEPGCTELEMVSANVERFLIATEILGPSGVHDPFETFAELAAMWDEDPSNDHVADPISGPDGIVFNDFDLNGDGVIDHDSLETDQKALIAIIGLVADSFAECVAGAPTVNFCWRNLDSSRPIGAGAIQLSASDPRLVGALPVAWRLGVGRPSLDATEPIPIQKLSGLELQQLEAFDQVTVEGARIGKPPGAVTLYRQVVNTLLPPEKQLPIDLGSLLDLDQDSASSDTRVRDLDQDADSTLDFVDDGTPGPGAAGNFLCGTGIPGDVLQDAQQVDFDDRQRALLAASGLVLPSRSPEFCTETGQFVDLTGPTRDARRAFLWQGALPAERIDGDADGDVDFEDLQAIVDARNTTARGADDPLDLDGDGRITLLDARKASLLCTRIGCASLSGAAPASLDAFLAGAAAAVAPTAVPALSRWGVPTLSLLLLAAGWALRHGRGRGRA